MAGTGTRSPVPGAKRLRALHGALEHSLTIQLARLQEVVDEYVGRGALSRADADKLVGQLLTTSRGYSQAMLDVLDSVAADARKGVAARLAPVAETADKMADRASQVPRMVAGAVPRGRSGTPEAAREPIPGYELLTVAEIKPLLAGLGTDDLERIRAQEAAGKARKGVLGEIDRLSGS